VQPCRSIRPIPWVVIVAAMSLAGAGHAETLEEAFSAALASNPTLAAQREQLAATSQDVEISRSAFFPRLTLSASSSRGNLAGTQLTAPTASTGLGLNQTSSGYSVTLEQPLFDGLRTYNAFNEAREITEAAHDDLRAAQLKLLLQTVRDYVSVLRDRAFAALRKKGRDMLAEDLANAKKLEAQGQATRTDLDQTSARLELARATLAEAEANLAASEAIFEQTIGHAPAALAPPVVPDATLPQSLQAAQAQATQHNPEIFAALHREQAAKRAFEKVKADLLPQVTLDASYGRTYSNPVAVTDAGDAQLTVHVTLPISLGGETIAKLRQANFVLRQRRQETVAKRSDVTAQLASTWSTLAGLRKQAEFSRAAAAATKRALRGIRVQRKAGDKTALDVLNAEQDLVQAQLQAIQTRDDLVVSAYALLTAMGPPDPQAN
jgi:outer membrane protein